MTVRSGAVDDLQRSGGAVEVDVALQQTLETGGRGPDVEDEAAEAGPHEGVHERGGESVASEPARKFEAKAAYVRRGRDARDTPRDLIT